MNKGINKSLLDVNELSDKINQISTTSNVINEIFRALRNKILINMLKN